MKQVYTLFVTHIADADCHAKLVGIFTTRDLAHTEAKFSWNPKEYHFSIEEWTVNA
jgi:hypothetical protein